MRNPDEAGRWLETAEDDLKWARSLAEQGAYNIACFLSQQSAEKALKALLFHLGEELVWGHSVRDLCERAAALLPAAGAACQEWGALDQFYVPTRYPDALPGSTPAKVYGKDAAKSAVLLTADIIDFVSEHVRSWDQPPTA